MGNTNTNTAVGYRVDYRVDIDTATKLTEDAKKSRMTRPRVAKSDDAVVVLNAVTQIFEEYPQYGWVPEKYRAELVDACVSMARKSLRRSIKDIVFSTFQGSLAEWHCKLAYPQAADKRPKGAVNYDACLKGRTRDYFVEIKTTKREGDWCKIDHISVNPGDSKCLLSELGLGAYMADRRRWYDATSGKAGGKNRVDFFLLYDKAADARPIGYLLLKDYLDFSKPEQSYAGGVISVYVPWCKVRSVNEFMELL